MGLFGVGIYYRGVYYGVIWGREIYYRGGGVLWGYLGRGIYYRGGGGGVIMRLFGVGDLL